MQAWLESIAGPDYAAALMWTLLALVALVIVLVIVRLVRGLTFGTFVAGGKNRKARLAVMDATAVDSNRRLVLVRRDDIEHLLLIGGPTDVVVEQNIRLLPPARRVAHEDVPVHTHAAESAPEFQPAPPAAPRPAPVQPVVRPATVTQPPAPQPARPVAPAPRPAAPLPVNEPRYSPPAPTIQAQPAPVQRPVVVPEHQNEQEVRTVRPVMAPVSSAAAIAPAVALDLPAIPSRPAPSAPEAPKQDLDSALLEELEVSLERDHRSTTLTVSDADLSLDEEMSKLLSDLSGQKP